jgi:DNA-binding NarL/FixJ family response regulator
MINVAIVEDIDDLREAMVSLVQGQEDLLCVFSFSNGEDALIALSENPVDVVLMDIHLPGISGIECLAQLKQKHPAMQFMMCTIFQDDDNIFKALKAGASGYLLKGDDPAKIIAAIHDLSTGGSPMNATIARRVIDTFHKPEELMPQDTLLTRREHELLALLAKGLRYKEIAAQLFISIETVRKHINNIYTKLQVQSRMDAVNKVFGTKR